MKAETTEEQLRHIVTQEFLVMARLGKILSDVASPLSKLTSDKKLCHVSVLEHLHKDINPVINYLIDYLDGYDWIADEDAWVLKIIEEANKIKL